MISRPSLWQAIERHPPGGEQQALLLRKLAAQQDWSARQCEQALAEYRRFVYLACVSPVPVSPSRAVDALWHLHLTFSRDYWQVFCPRVLGRDLHHDPDTGDDPAAMQAQYRATLALYRAEFDREPPAALWDCPAPSRRRARWPALAMLAGLAALALWGGAALAAGDNAARDYDGLIAFAALALVAYILYRVFRPEYRSRRRDRNDSGSGGNCGSCSSCSGSSCSSCGSGCGGGGGGD